jgi:hypothetical protein
MRHPTPANLPQSTTHYPTLRAHIKSLPTWFQQLICDYTQLASNAKVWRASGAQRKIIIASNGRLMDTAGTFGRK